MRWKDPGHTLLNAGYLNHMDAEAARAPRAKARKPRISQHMVDGRLHYAISAHDLLDQESEADRARPGHLLG